MFKLLILINVSIFIHCKSIGNKYENKDDRLMLTPLISSGEIGAAQQKSRVFIPGFEDIESYSGFITVDEIYNSNLFFWFFKSKHPNAPLAIWFQGGPGGSSLVGLFHENGPLEVVNNTLFRRKYSWTNLFHVIYVDSPMGTGLSFTESEDGYTRNQSQITDHLYTFLQQFLAMFPDQRSNELYLMGQSYGCKSVVDLSYKIHSLKDSSINLKGFVIGGGFCDPVSQSQYGKFLYSKNLLTAETAMKFLIRERYLQHLMYRKEFRNATEVWRSLQRFNKSINFYNYKDRLSGFGSYKFEAVITQPKYRSMLHIGDAVVNSLHPVFHYLKEDFMQSVKSSFPILFENYKVLIFNGDLDVICAAPLMDELVDSVDWKYANVYKNSLKQNLLIDGQIMGYTRESHNFTRGVIFEAGHLTPYDQPSATYHLMKQFINS